MEVPKILIVEDEFDERHMLAEFISTRVKSEVIEAKDADEALKALGKDAIDVMILDIRMPGKSGIDLLDEMGDKREDIDTLVVTAWDSDLVAEECVKRGADCMLKPASLKDIFAKIQKLLEKRGQFIPL